MAAHRRKKESKYSKFIVLLCIVTIILFTQQCMFFTWNEHDVPSVLIIAFFLCFGFEFGSLAFIKRGEYRYVAGSGDRVGHVERIEENENN